MQSFMQYRQFGKRLRSQLAKIDEETARAKDEERASAIWSTPLSGSTAPSPRSGTTSIHAAGNVNSDDAGGSDEGEQVPSSDTDEKRPDLLHLMTGIEPTRTRSKIDGNQQSGKTKEVFVVSFQGDDDPMNPHNWSRTVRLAATINIALIALVVGFASSVDSGALREASKEFQVSEVVESLATGLFLVGFGVGALFAGPISETVGRNPVYIATLILYMIFVMASALAPNIGSQLAFRFIAGCFASSPLTCAGGSIADLWDPMERVWAFPIFANAAFCGPILGPVLAGLFAESTPVSWRWTEWVSLIMSALVLTLVTLLQPETYTPILLKWKAAHLRNITGDNRYKAEVEIREQGFLTRLTQSLYRPFLLTFSEPIIILIALFLTVIYIVLFTFLNGYTFIFSETYGFSEGLTGLSFLGIGIGLFMCTLLTPLIYKWAKDEIKKAREQGSDRLSPEFRLWFAMLGAPAIPISLFWMGWTTYPHISYWSPLVASAFFGYGILSVFITSYQYIIDSYEGYSASALTSVTLIRYVAAGGMVEVAIPFYKNLGVHWTLTIMGCLSALLVPVPYVFYKYGSKLRARSKYAVV